MQRPVPVWRPPALVSPVVAAVVFPLDAVAAVVARSLVPPLLAALITGPVFAAVVPRPLLARPVLAPIVTVSVAAFVALLVAPFVSVIALRQLARGEWLHAYWRRATVAICARRRAVPTRVGAGSIAAPSVVCQGWIGVTGEPYAG